MRQNSENPCVAGSIPALPSALNRLENSGEVPDIRGQSDMAQTGSEASELANEHLTVSDRHCGRIVEVQKEWRFSRLPKPESYASIEFEITVLGDVPEIFRFERKRWTRGGGWVKREVVAAAMGCSVDYVAAIVDCWNLAHAEFIDREADVDLAETRGPECLWCVPSLCDATKYSPGDGYVYFLVDGNEVVYVGQTRNLKTRIQSHRKDKVFTAAFFIFVPRNDMSYMENKYIKQFSPKYNIQSAPRATGFGA